MLVGAATALLALKSALVVDLPDVAPITAKSDDGEIVESFFARAPDDAVTLTHSGKLPFATFPPSVASFSDSAVARALALVVRLRNANGEVVGYGSELEVHPEGGAFGGDAAWLTDWTVVIPGRGVLFLHQRERSGALASEVLAPVLATRRVWEGERTVQTTAGPRPDGRGVIVGGTGEFANASGSFVEIDRVTRLTPEGTLEGTFELRLFREAR